MRNRKKITTLLFLLLLLTIIAIGEFIIYETFHTIGLLYGMYLKIFIAKLIILPLLFLITAYLGFNKFSKIGSFIYIITALFIGLVMYLVAGTLFLTILILINSFVAPLPLQLIGMIILIVLILLTLYGFINASNPRIVKWSTKSEALKDLWKDKKIILISDTHFGQIRREKFARKIVNIINKENPDIVFHVGDLIDGPSIPYEKTFAPLMDLNPPLGTLYVEGNHERYSQEYDKFRTYFPKCFTDMTDRKIIVNNTQIIGLSYRMNETHEETRERLKALGYDENIPSIVLLHDPKNSRALTDINVSMVLSGHTHGGQFFPITMIVRRIYKALAHGVSYENNTASVTTYGVGTAMMPMRVGTIPEIVILQIV